MNPRARIKVAKSVKGSYSTTRHCTASPPLSIPSKFMKFPVWYIIQVHPSDLIMYRDLTLSQWASTIISGLFRVVILVFSRNFVEKFFSLASRFPLHGRPKVKEQTRNFKLRIDRNDCHLISQRLSQWETLRYLLVCKHEYSCTYIKVAYFSLAIL